MCLLLIDIVLHSHKLRCTFPRPFFLNLLLFEDLQLNIHFQITSVSLDLFSCIEIHISGWLIKNTCELGIYQKRSIIQVKISKFKSRSVCFSTMYFWIFGFLKYSADGTQQGGVNQLLILEMKFFSSFEKNSLIFSLR